MRRTRAGAEEKALVVPRGPFEEPDSPSLRWRGWWASRCSRRARLQNILTRALGVDADTEVDIIDTDLRPGDFLVACTDGLNKVVPDSRILETVGRMKTPKMIAEHLVDLANAGGGVDNTTVVVARMEK